MAYLPSFSFFMIFCSKVLFRIILRSDPSQLWGTRQEWVLSKGHTSGRQRGLVLSSSRRSTATTLRLTLTLALTITSALTLTLILIFTNYAALDGCIINKTDYMELDGRNDVTIIGIDHITSLSYHPHSCMR